MPAKPSPDPPPLTAVRDLLKDAGDLLAEWLGPHVNDHADRAFDHIKAALLQLNAAERRD